jgi:RNA polymerase sigma-70 factor (ECF subfamily)
VVFLKLKHKSQLLPDHSDQPDELLVSLYLESQDKELVAELFERYTHLVYGICLNYLQDPDLSKDAVMDIFESLFSKLSVHRITNFRSWLYTVTRNHCLMDLRKAGSQNKAKDRLKTELSETESMQDVEEEDEMMLNKGLIISAVEQLNNEQGTCIRLMYIDDKSYRDISAITGFTMNEVKSHIQNGKRNLKNLLHKQDENHGS